MKTRNFLQFHLILFKEKIKQLNFDVSILGTLVRNVLGVAEVSTLTIGFGGRRRVCITWPASPATAARDNCRLGKSLR